MARDVGLPGYGKGTSDLYMGLPGPTGVSGNLLVAIFKDFFEGSGYIFGRLPVILCLGGAWWLWRVECTYKPQSVR